MLVDKDWLMCISCLCVAKVCFISMKPAYLVKISQYFWKTLLCCNSLHGSCIACACSIFDYFRNVYVISSNVLGVGKCGRRIIWTTIWLWMGPPVVSYHMFSQIFTNYTDFEGYCCTQRNFSFGTFRYTLNYILIEKLKILYIYEGAENNIGGD